MKLNDLTIYTIGHSTRSSEEFAELLVKNNIRTLVDVRTSPGSKRFPHFNQERMLYWIKEYGIEYMYIPELGGLRKDVIPDSPNGYWRKPIFRSYADYQVSNPTFKVGLDQLISQGYHSNSCYFCSEADHRCCHRTIVSDVLVSQGAKVIHIGSKGTLTAHKLNENACVDCCGRVTYPAKEEQLELLLT